MTRKINIIDFVLRNHSLMIKELCIKKSFITSFLIPFGRIQLNKISNTFKIVCNNIYIMDAFFFDRNSIKQN